MDAESSLLDKIRSRQANLVVLGLGHVGLPTALMFARAGFNVTGIDIDARKVETLKQGTCYIREPGLQEVLATCLDKGTFQVSTDGSHAIRASDFIGICVPTPVENTAPDLRSFKAAFNAVKFGSHKGMMITIESTLPPSTMSLSVAPDLQRLGYRIDEDIFLAYCPERIAPVSALEEFVNSPRVIGGIGPRSSEIAAEFYKTVCKHVLITDCLTAELTKLAENTFRDIGIAYANLVALIAEQFGADVNETIRLANTHPRVRILRPGLGVGGACIPKDPLILVQGIPQNMGQLVKSARKLNDNMIGHVIDVLKRTFSKKGMDIGRAKVVVLGVAYKPETEDITNSPAKSLINGLLGIGASVVTYDPYTTESYGARRALSLEDALEDADCIILVTAHNVFKSLDIDRVAQLARKKCLIYDGPRILDPKGVKAAGLTYLGIGYGIVDP